MKFIISIFLMAGLLCAKQTNAAVVNGGFENGTLEGWQISWNGECSASVTTGSAPEGTHYAVLNAHSYDHVNIPPPILIQDSNPVQANMDFSQSFSAYAGDTLSLSCRVNQNTYIQNSGMGSPWASTSGYVEVLGNNYNSRIDLSSVPNSWTTLRFSTLPTAGNYTVHFSSSAQALAVYPQFNTAESNFKIEIDNVSTDYGIAPLENACTIPGLFNTGVDNNGIPLPNNANVVDPHYTIIQNPANTGPQAHLHDETAYPFNQGLWMNNTSTSKWINPEFQGSTASGDYTYRTTFDLSELNPTTATIVGHWATDNAKIGIYLNGTLVVAPPSVDPQFGSFTSFVIPTGSPFLPGLNTLDFKFNNSYSQTGIIISDLQGTAQLVPEPSTLSLLGVGMISLLAYTYTWRRKTAA